MTLPNNTVIPLPVEKTASAVIEAFDIEISRILDDKERNLILDFILGCYYSNDLFTFFTPLNLKKTTNEIFENEKLRAFIMNLSERVSFLLAVEDVQVDSVIKSLSKNICINKPNPELSTLINKEVAASIFSNEETIEKLFISNFWILVLYITIVLFQQTKSYVGMHNRS